MPISEAITEYHLALDAFAASSGARDVPGLFHAVRNLAYFSDGARSALAVMQTRRGACTAKHILLRDLLRRQGTRAEVELVAGDFAAAVPQAPSMPAPLRTMIQVAGVRDFHCFVVWHRDGHETRLDATWPDALAAHGFAVNARWAGRGDTTLATTPDGITRRAEDVIAAKEELLASLSDAEADKRRRFLTLLSDWIATRP